MVAEGKIEGGWGRIVANRFVKPARRKKTPLDTRIGHPRADLASMRSASRREEREKRTKRRKGKKGKRGRKRAWLAARAERIARTCTRRVHVRARRRNDRSHGLGFSLITNRPVFSIFKDAHVARIRYLSTTLVPARLPLLRACLPVRVCTWRKWSSPRPRAL